MMRQSSNSGRRLRGRPNRNKPHSGTPNRNSTFESNGPEGKVRGNAAQVFEKYVALAREAAAGGNRVGAEAFYQHAEHYYRIINDSTDPRPDHLSGQGGFGARDGQRPPRRNGVDGEAPRRFPAEGDSAVAPTSAMPEFAAGQPVISKADGAPAKPTDANAAGRQAPQAPSAATAASDAAVAAAEPVPTSGEQTKGAGGEPRPTPGGSSSGAGGDAGGDGAGPDADLKAEPSERPRRGRPRKTATEAKAEGERPRRGRPRKVKPPAETEEPQAAENTEKSGDTAA